MKYSAYSRYKKAKVAWIGEIPSHWQEWKVTHGFGLIGSGTTPKSDDDSFYGGETLWITTSELRESVITQTQTTVTKKALSEYSALRVYPKGSVVIAMYGATIGRLGVLGKEATVNQACCVFSAPEQFHLQFFYYWLWMRRSVLISLSFGGGQPNLSQDELKQIRVPIPSISEQEKIADFLDHKTKQIDALIARKKELIAKLKEERVAVINRTMMGKAVEYKPKPGETHRPWDFNLPRSWRRIKLKYFTYMKGRLGWQNLKRDEYTESGPYLVSSEHFAADRIQWEQVNHVSQERFEMAPEIILKVDDVLFMKDGAAMGKLAYVVSLPSEACLNSHLLLLRPDRNQVLPKFLYYALKSVAFIAYMIQERVGTTFFGFSEESMGNYPLSFPNVDEQKEILKDLDSETARIDRMINKIETAIERVTEYRTALITAATTGKIDVRKVNFGKAK